MMVPGVGQVQVEQGPQVITAMNDAQLLSLMACELVASGKVVPIPGDPRLTMANGTVATVAEAAVELAVGIVAEAIVQHQSGVLGMRVQARRKALLAMQEAVKEQPGAAAGIQVAG
jgi:hypothetical protein